MLEDYRKDLEERFMRYVRIDTQSDEVATTVPSTAKQFDLLTVLRDELQALGAHDVVLTGYGAVFATIPATADKAATPTVALFAHVDTSPAYSGENVKPIIHRAYNGAPISLPNDPVQVLRAEDFPYLKSKIGDDIITASGDTLLGADDKAGIAIIMTVAAYLLEHQEVPHGKVRIAFTSDEEIGLGVRSIPMEDIGADVAYTLDGMEAGEITYETFSADKAVVDIRGVSTHPGTAKGVLVNALLLAAKLIDFLPQNTRTPETTSDREGFIHLYQMKGNAAEAQLSFILRDFELKGLQAHGDLLQHCCTALQLAEPRAQINCAITPQYRNMRYWLENDMRPVEIAVRALRRIGLEPLNQPIRGGTDGSQLTERGLPTPNIFTGMQNVHGPLEWISLQDMEKATETCIHLLQLWAEEPA
jgi:tripeptide aminopeptidase